MSEQEPTLDEFVDTPSNSVDKGQTWEVKQLRDLVNQLQAGGTPDTNKDEYYDGEIPWVKTGELGQLKIDSTEQTITEQGLNESTARLFPSKTVLIAMYGATTGELSILDTEAATNQACCGIIPNNQIIPYYLYYQLIHGKPKLRSFSAGSGQQNISKSILEKYRIPVAPLSEQRKIATVLYTVDQAIDKTRQIIQKLHRIKKGCIQENILNKISKTQSPTDLGKLPTDWEKVSIEEVANDKPDSLVDGPFGSSLKSDEFVEEGYARVIQLKNVREAKYVDANLQFVTREKYDELERHGAKPGDIYIAKMASPVARACILPDTYDQYMMGCADVVKLEPSEEFVDEFVMYCLNSYPVWKQAAAHIRGGGRMRINLNQLKEVHIPKPPLSEQKRIVDGMNSINSAIDVHERQKQNIHRLKQGLMQDLLSGTVRTTDTNIDVPNEVAQHG